MAVLELPTGYSVRDYQRPFFEEFGKGYKRFGLICWNRRAGKDLTCLNIMIAKALERIGTYFYFFPDFAHARRAIWNNITKDGKKFLDFIPKSVIAGRPNNSDMRINLINGSLIQFMGIDNYDRIVGTNPLGVVLSEYSLQNPLGWHYVSPILGENGGWALFNFTPRGKNHAFKMFTQAQNNPDFFWELLTIDDTKTHTPEQIDAFRRQGIPEDKIQQEYYGSFEAAVQGAYYAEQIRLAQKEGRIRDFEINPGAPTYTFWDLGVRDPMAIWVMQKVGYEFRMIYYYENSGGGVKNAIDWLVHLKEKHNLIYVKHYAPHDIAQKNVLTGRTRLEECQDFFGFNFEMVRQSRNIIEDINSTRNLFYRMHFHATNCDQGLAAIQEYHANYDEKTGWIGDPVHNWASHGADALRTFGVAWSEYEENPHSFSGNFILPEWHV